MVTFTSYVLNYWLLLLFKFFFAGHSKKFKLTLSDQVDKIISIFLNQQIFVLKKLVDIS